MRKSYIILIFTILCLLYATTSTGEVLMNNGLLYVNNVLIESEDAIQFKSQEMLFPLRTVFESLGANVIWKEESKDILINYNGMQYNCYIKEPNPSYSKYFYIKNITTNEYIYLTPMSMGGAYEIINDRIYLHQDTGKRLFEAIGCKVDINISQNTIISIIS